MTKRNPRRAAYAALTEDWRDAGLPSQLDPEVCR